jgi:hypothetical protein
MASGIHNMLGKQFGDNLKKKNAKLKDSMLPTID